MLERLTPEQNEKYQDMVFLLESSFSPDIILQRTSANLAVLYIQQIIGKIHQSDLDRQKAILLDNVARANPDVARNLRRINDIGTLVWVAQGNDVSLLSDPQVAEEARRSF